MEELGFGPRSISYGTLALTTTPSLWLPLVCGSRVRRLSLLAFKAPRSRPSNLCGFSPVCTLRPRAVGVVVRMAEPDGCELKFSDPLVSCWMALAKGLFCSVPQFPLLEDWDDNSPLGRWQKAVAPHSSTLAWKIPWMEEPGRLQSMGLLRAGHD